MSLRIIAAAAIAGLAMTVATGAAAATYTITIPGTITSVVNPGPISVGDPFTLTTTFDDNWVVAWGDTGYNVAFAYSNFGGGPLPTSGPLNWSIALDGFTYAAVDDLHDGGPVYYEGPVFAPTRGLGGPAIVFNSSGVFGVDNLDLDDTTHARPLLLSQNGSIGLFPGSGSAPGNFQPLKFSNAFGVQRSDYQNPNTTPDQHAVGVWDFSAATIVASALVPEPSTWAMMIAGFGLLGGAMRIQRRRQPLGSA